MRWVLGRRESNRTERIKFAPPGSRAVRNGRIGTYRNESFISDVRDGKPERGALGAVINTVINTRPRRSRKVSQERIQATRCMHDMLSAFRSQVTADPMPAQRR